MKKIEDYTYVDLYGLGIEGIFVPEAFATWRCSDKENNKYPHIIFEPIKRNLIGHIYYGLLFEAFINH